MAIQHRRFQLLKHIFETPGLTRQCLLHASFIAMVSTLACNPPVEEDEETPDSNTPTTVAENSGTSNETPTTTATEAGSESSLSLAFPSELNIGTTLTPSSASAGLALQGSEESVDTIEEPLSIAEKQEVIEDILDTTEIAQCFKLVVGNFPQPSCFAPYATAQQITDAASSDNPFVISTEESFQRILYGDAGMVKANEGTQACSTATISYFTEDALQYIEQAKQIFASLICASKFTSTTLPEAGQETDYLPVLTGVELPDQAEFNQATIAREATAEGDIYTTRLSLTFPGEFGARKTHAVFRNRPATTSNPTSKGHVVVIQSNVPDFLSTANGEQFSSQPKGVAAVSVRYQIQGELKEVYLDRFDVKSEAMSSIHPADLINSDGTLDFVGISEEVAGGDNNAAQNFFQTKFTLNPNITNHNNGIVGWTASLGDGNWRSFAYTVEKTDNGLETAKATFGFASANTGGGGHSQALSNFDDSTAPNKMYCAWAQQSGDAPDPNQDQQLQLNEQNPPPNDQEGGIGGQAANLVQFQVAIKVNSETEFIHDATQSGISYKITQDCGGDSSENTLEPVESDGSITSKFTAPVFSNFTALSGLSLNSSSMPLE